MMTTRTSVPDWLKTLNPEQLEAVRHVTGPALVLAGAGSGKTRVLTVRVAHLIQNHSVDPGSILAITFTNKAAREMRERLQGLLGGGIAGGPWVGTFHAFGAWILRQYGPLVDVPRSFSILDAEDSLKVLRQICDRLDLDVREWPPQSFRWVISSAKNQLLDPDDLQEAVSSGAYRDELYRIAPRVYASYEAELGRNGTVDFDDLLLQPVRLLRSHESVRRKLAERFRFILIDEYQDTNPAQSVIVELLAREHRNVMAVGDPDQAIYGFRGADIHNILQFEETYRGARVIRLERNYRSAGNILEAANALIAHNLDRKPKTLVPVHQAGEKIVVAELPSDLDEARWIADSVQEEIDRGTRASDIAILYRTNAQSRPIEEAFRRAGIAYRIVGGLAFYQRREVKDALAYLRLIANPGDTVAFLRCVNYPKRGIGETSQRRVIEWAQEHRIAVLEAAARAEEIEGLTKRARVQLREFAAMMQRFAARASVLPVGDLLEEILAETEFTSALLEEGEEGADRVENIDALLSSAAEFDPVAVAVERGMEINGAASDLDLFLEQVALVSEEEEHGEEEVSDRVTLMTLHASKGLEFPVVFIAGLEDGLLPHSRSLGDRVSLEEERRLLYVGITRAMERLRISWARMRRSAGSLTESTVSPFLAEIPRDVIEMIRPYNLAQKSAVRFRRDVFGSQASQIAYGNDGDLDQDVPRFVRGEEVIHPTLGSGRIVEVHGAFPNCIVVVDFGPSHGKRILQARTSGLRRGFQ